MFTHSVENSFMLALTKSDMCEWEEMHHLHWWAGKGRSIPVHLTRSAAPASSLWVPWGPELKTPVCWESREHPGWSASLRARAVHKAHCQTAEHTHIILQPQIAWLVQHWENSRELAEVCQSVSKSRDTSYIFQ